MWQKKGGVGGKGGYFEGIFFLFQKKTKLFLFFKLTGNLRHDARVAPPLALHLVGHGARHARLLGVVHEDGAAVLAAAVGPLPVARRRVVHAEEELEQLPVRDARRVEDDLQRFGVCPQKKINIFFILC